MKTIVIAEIGSNWDCLDDILYSCEFAVKRECWPKLQLWKTELVVNKLRHPEMFRVMKKFELKEDWVKKINERFSSTFYSVFDLKSLAFLETEIKPEKYKIASPDCVYEPLVKAVAATGKETIVSVGGATLNEIRRCVNHFTWKNLTLLECNASYPAGCGYLGNLRDRINGSRLVPWGYSDHTTSEIVPAMAVSLGAVIIEKHFCLNRVYDTPDAKHSLGPTQFKSMLNNIKEAEFQLKTLEHPFPEEIKTMELARRKADGKR